jgi:hypothetical protein
MAAGNWSVFTSIMLFYILLSYVIFPGIFYYTMGKTLKQAGRGFVVGSIISLLLWQFYGSKMI